MESAPVRFPWRSAAWHGNDDKNSGGGSRVGDRRESGGNHEKENRRASRATTKKLAILRDSDDGLMAAVAAIWTSKSGKSSRVVRRAGADAPWAMRCIGYMLVVPYMLRSACYSEVPNVIATR
jgi:hypothetical protein